MAGSRTRAGCSPTSRRKLVFQRHPLRPARHLVREVLKELSRSLGHLYASEGRPSIPPEQLLSALMLQVFYGIRSERQLIEHSTTICCPAGLSPDDAVWDATSFSKNRELLQSGDIFAKFMTRLLNHPQVQPLLSNSLYAYCHTVLQGFKPAHRAHEEANKPALGSSGCKRLSR